MNAKQAMRLIKHLDSTAHIEFSEYTDKWFVGSRIEVGGDGTLQGATEHRDTPEEAIEAFLGRIQHIPDDRYLVTNAMYEGERAHYRWDSRGGFFKRLAIHVPR